MTGSTVITGIENKPSLILMSVETSRPVVPSGATVHRDRCNGDHLPVNLRPSGNTVATPAFYSGTIEHARQGYQGDRQNGQPFPSYAGKRRGMTHCLLNAMLGVIEKQRGPSTMPAGELQAGNGELEEVVEEVQLQRDEALDKARQELTGTGPKSFLKRSSSSGTISMKRARHLPPETRTSRN